MRPVDFLLRQILEFDPHLMDQNISINWDNKPTPSSKLLVIWKNDNKTLDNFWHKWSREYLLSLKERKNLIKKDFNLLPEIGKHIIIFNDNLVTMEIGSYLQLNHVKK